jgi:uncharacterized repeat protein (TIGR02543 family)
LPNSRYNYLGFRVTRPDTNVPTYTVTYHINGGTGTTPTAQAINGGNNVTLASDSSFTRNGFTFGGWNTNTSGAGTNYSAGTSFTPTSNITLYARWISGGSISGTSDIEMVWIPAGTFIRGSNDSLDFDANASPAHQVTLTSGFLIGKYHVTQDQYQAVMGSNPSWFHGGSGREPAAGEVQGRRPVESVNWYDALVFCNRLSILEGLTPAYEMQTEANTSIWSTDPNTWGAVPSEFINTRWDAVRVVTGSTGYRLPTDAQWEYACRAGTTTAYNTGEMRSNNTGWNWENSNSRTREVGRLPPNSWGLYDMHGNVWEWCWDWYGTYSSGAQTDPVGASSGSYRVHRGGWWGIFEEIMRSAARSGWSADLQHYGIGFRVTRP